MPILVIVNYKFEEKAIFLGSKKRLILIPKGGGLILMYHCSSIFLNRSQGEPLLKPVTVVSSTDQPVYHSRPATRHEQDVEGEGCCHFSNNFYLTAAFGFVFAVICVFQVSILGPAAPTALNPSFYLFLDVFLSRFWLYTTYLCL